MVAFEFGNHISATGGVGDEVRGILNVSREVNQRLRCIETLTIPMRTKVKEMWWKARLGNIESTTVDAAALPFY